MISPSLLTRIVVKTFATEKENTESASGAASGGIVILSDTGIYHFLCYKIHREYG
jgi:hypothetical protein